MKRPIYLIHKLTLFFIFISLFIVFFSLPKSAISQTNSITIIGDSLTDGSRNQLSQAFPSAVINAEIGRQWSTGISILNQLKTEGRIGEKIVFPLGTNGPITAGDIDTLISLADGKPIVLMTLYSTSVSWINANNTIIRNAANNHSNIEIADWNRVASNQPNLIGPDGTHPTPAGYNELATLLINTINQSSSDTTNSSSPSVPHRTDSNVITTRVGNPTLSDFEPGTIPPFPSNIPASLYSRFNISISGFDLQHQQWVWELVWSTSTTKFPQLLSGISVQASSGGISQQLGCGSPGVILGQYNGAEFFKFIATHEFAHYIQICKPRSETKLNEAINAMSIEGAVSWYGGNGNPACFSDTSNHNENHADIISYFLHPNAGFSSGPRNCVPPAFQNPPNPFYSGQSRFPLQFDIAKSILTL